MNQGTPNPRLKPFRNYDEQISILVARGMEVSDVGRATNRLKQIGYYRLSFYSYRWRDLNSSTDNFRPSTNFDDVVALYDFDQALRNHIFLAIDQIEVTVRSHLGHILGSIDESAHMDPLNFKPSLDYIKVLSTILSRFSRASQFNDPVARHHVQTYGAQAPIWVLVDFLDFSDLSRIYSTLKAPLQHEIAQEIGLLPAQRRNGRAPDPSLQGWLHQLTIIRNYCAHHARLWDRALKPQNIRDGKKNGFFSDFDARKQSTDIYGASTIIAFLLSQFSDSNLWAVQLRELIEGCAKIIDPKIVAEMGFPDNWKSLHPWNIK